VTRKSNEQQHQHTAEHLLSLIHRDLLRLGKILERIPLGRPTIGLQLSGVFSKDGTMAIVPFSLPASLDFAVTTKPADASGQPTTPTLTWVNSDDTIFTLEVAPDAMSAKGRVKAPGTSTITVTDTAAGVSDTINITVTPNADGTVTINSTVATIAKGA
jgi:hypothetical protein